MDLIRPFDQIKHPKRPFEEDSERGLLCCLAKKPGEVAAKCFGLKPEAFYVPAHQIIYETMLEWHKPEQEVVFEWLRQTLSERNQLDEVGGKEFLNAIYGFGAPPENVEYYIEPILEAHGRRRCLDDCEKRMAAAVDRTNKEWDPDGKYLGILSARKLTGASFLDFSGRQIDEAKTLLGDRYLCRGGGAFLVAPSGHGKSVLTAQAAIELACGLPAFGIKPTKPLRSLIVQAEDDDGDIIEMAQIVNHLELSYDQRKLVGSNTHVEFVNDATGTDFLNICDGFLSQWKADLIWINPYTAYLGADIKDDGENTRFLRNGLNPLLTKHDCGAVVIHHTPKTNFRDTTNWKPSDWMYSGAGAAVLTNWARAYLAIDPCEEQGIYKFIAAKRGKRIGWGDRFPVFEQYWTHSTQEGQLLWLPANQEQIAASKPQKQKNADDLLELIPALDPLLQEKLFEIAKSKSIGEKKVRQFLKILINDGKAYEHQIRRQGVKSAIGYSKTPASIQE